MHEWTNMPCSALSGAWNILVSIQCALNNSTYWPLVMITVLWTVVSPGLHVRFMTCLSLIIILFRFRTRTPFSGKLGSFVAHGAHLKRTWCILCSARIWMDPYNGWVCRHHLQYRHRYYINLHNIASNCWNHLLSHAINLIH